MRFNYDDNYFYHKYQGMPEHGYTAMVERILDHPAIEVKLGTHFRRDQSADFAHLFYSGPLDGYFGHQHSAGLATVRLISSGSPMRVIIKAAP